EDLRNSNQRDACNPRSGALPGPPDAPPHASSSLMTYSLSRISSSAPVPSSSEPGDAASLRRNVAWALAGNLGYSACQWGVLVCIATIAPAADAGQFALGLALTSPIISLTTLNLRLLHA